MNVHASPLPHTESGMISFLSLYFFIYSPSRFEVDIGAYIDFFKSGEVKLCIINLKYAMRAKSIENGEQYSVPAPESSK